MQISIRTIATLALAALFGIIAVGLARSYLTTPQGPLKPIVTGSIPVVVAAKPLARGVSIQPDMVKVVEYPAGSAPTGAFSSLDAFTGQNSQRLALSSMVENEPVLPGNVSGPGGKLNLSTIVSPGMRAVSLRGGDVVGVGGFVLPGDRVDVLLTRAQGSGNDAGQITQVLADNVRVLGIDQSDDSEADKPVVARAVTVEVTPDQAQAISLAQAVGTVSLMLRHVADDAPLPHTITTIADLGGAQQSHRVHSSGAVSGVRVIRGLETSHFSFATGSSLNHISEEVKAGGVSP